MNRGRTTTPMQLPTEFGVGAGEVPRGERERRESSPAREPTAMHLGEGVGVGAGGVAAAADAEDIEAPDCVGEFRAAADGADFEGGDGDRDVEVAVLHLGGRDGVRALDDLRPSCPVARNIAATTLATWALNPRLAASRSRPGSCVC